MQKSRCPKCQSSIDLEKDSAISPQSPPWVCPGCGAKLEKGMSPYFNWQIALVLGGTSIIVSSLLYLLFSTSEKVSSYIGITVAIVAMWWFVIRSNKLVEK